MTKIRIGTKFIIAYLTVIGLFIAFFYFNNVQFQNRSVEAAVQDEIKQDKLSFEFTKDRDINMLSAILMSIIQDPTIKDIYLQKDRDRLYEKNQALFSDLKSKNGITNWAFILPDGHVFLRMDQKDVYDDVIDLATFQKARDTGQVASGIELGKTAYALRVITPYYDNGQLIGYVGLAEAMDHFLMNLKRDSDNELSILADKSILNQDDWAVARQTAGLRNNWNDIAGHVLVGATADSQATQSCFTQEAAEQLEKSDQNFRLLQEKNKYFGCGGFEIKDTIGRHAGLVMLVADVSDHIALSKKNNRTATIYLGSFFALALLISFLISRSLSRSIKKLRDGSTKISHGELDYRVDIDSNDEIGELGNDLNALAEKVSQRTKELEEAKADVEKQVSRQTVKLQETLKEAEKSRLAVFNILEDVAGSEHLLRNKTIDLDKFQQAVDGSFDHIIITDADGIIVYANHAADEITGYSKEEMIGKNVGKLWGGQMPKEFYEKMWKTIKQEKSNYSGEITNLRKNGQKYLASIRIAPVLDKKGDIKFFVGAERDITDEREAQIRVIKHASELQKANALINQEKERTEGILQFLKSIGDGVVATDMDGKIIFFNEAAEQLTGAAGAKSIGKGATDVLEIFGEKNPEKLFDIVKEAIDCEGELCKTNDHFFVKRTDGSHIPVSFSTALIYDKHKKKQGCIMVMRNVSEERELEKTKDNFLSVAAHQLRTPLSGIRWSLEMLLEGDAGKLPKEAVEIIGSINENSQRLITSVNDLLNVSRINSGKSTQSPQPVSVAETITTVLKNDKSFAEKNKVKILFNKGKNQDLKVMIIPRRFSDAIENVLSNAVKYTPAKGKVTISVSEKNGTVEIAVADSGIGIPKKDQEKIFSKFFRAGNAVKKDPSGSGLGLNVVKSFIEEAGGKVSFESKEGKGTTFYMIMPVVKETK